MVFTRISGEANSRCTLRASALSWGGGRGRAGEGGWVGGLAGWAGVAGRRDWLGGGAGWVGSVQLGSRHAVPVGRPVTTPSPNECSTRSTRLLPCSHLGCRHDAGWPPHHHLFSKAGPCRLQHGTHAGALQGCKFASGHQAPCFGPAGCSASRKWALCKEHEALLQAR